MENVRAVVNCNKRCDKSGRSREQGGKELNVAESSLKQEQFGSPEDVATLFAWANMRGARYRDFSASRARAREESRRRVQETAEEERLRLLEQAQREAQEAVQRTAREAAEQAEIVRRAEAERLAEIARQAKAEREAVMAAQEAQRRAAAQGRERPSSFVPPVTAPVASPVSTVNFNEDRSSMRTVPVSLTADAESAHRFTAAVDNGSTDLAALYGAEMPAPEWPGRTGDNLYRAVGAPVEMPAALARASDLPHFPVAVPPLTDIPPRAAETTAPARQPVNSAVQSSAQRPSSEAAASALQEDWERPLLPSWLQELPHARAMAASEQEQVSQPHAEERIAPVVPISMPTSAATSNSWFAAASDGEKQQPAHAFESRAEVRTADAQRFPAVVGNPSFSEVSQANSDPLLASRERITRNWFALKSVFHPDQEKLERPMPQAPERVPVLAVFSLAGGVGKTSLLASIARALSSRSENVLMVDMSAYGLMPFFFGARDQKPGQLRTFSPPAATADAAIQMITLDPERLKADAGGRDELVQEIQRHSNGMHRVLIDMPTASGATMRRVLRLHPTVLVPVTPDMNSVVSVSAIESYFQNQIAQSNAQSQPLYVLNHFDPAQQLHLDVRNLLRERIGNRLLPFVLRSSSAVSEALAEGMTVMDYAPGTVIAEDYLNLANWIRSLSAPAAAAQRGVRWSER